MFTLTQQLENNHPVVVSLPNLQYRKLLTEVLCFSIKKLHQFYSLFRSSRTIFTMRRRNKFSCLFYTSMLYSKIWRKLHRTSSPSPCTFQHSVHSFWWKPSLLLEAIVFISFMVFKGKLIAISEYLYTPGVDQVY